MAKPEAGREKWGTTEAADQGGIGSSGEIDDIRGSEEVNILRTMGTCFSSSEKEFMNIEKEKAKKKMAVLD